MKTATLPVSLRPVLTISVFRNGVHIGTDIGDAFTPQEPGQPAMVEFFEGGSVMAPEQLGHTWKTPEVALRFAEAMENFGRAGIEIMLCGYIFRDPDQRDQAAYHIRRCAEVAEAYAEAA